MSFTIPAYDNLPYNPNVIVQDDYMPASYCELLCKEMGAYGFTWFPWYYGQVIPIKPETELHCDEIAPHHLNFQFSHRLYELGHDSSPFVHLTQPLIDKLNPDTLYKIKANLNTQYPEQIVHGYHTDIGVPGCTSILYLNDNNGKTIFKYKDSSTGEEKYQEVLSKQGRLVTFDNRTLHSGTTSTDTPLRLVLNLNYYKHDYFHENSWWLLQRTIRHLR